MAWFAELAGKAENLLNNLDEQTGAALRNQKVTRPPTKNITLLAQSVKKHDGPTFPEPTWSQKKRPIPSDGSTLTEPTWSQKKRPIPSDGSTFTEPTWAQKKRPIPSDGSTLTEPTWAQKKRPMQRVVKKIPPLDTKSNYIPSRKASPTSHHIPTRDSQDQRQSLPKPKKSPTKKMYSLDHCPKTLVGDVGQTELILDHRRRSYPPDLHVYSTDNLTLKLENLEVENAMLKNELNVTNIEVADLIDSLRRAEDGERVVSDCSKELSTTKTTLQNTENLNTRANADRDTLSSQFEHLKSQLIITTAENNKLKEENMNLGIENSNLKGQNEELEAIIKNLNENSTESDSIKIKLENDLRHAQGTIMSLQSDLVKSNNECKRLEKDWDTYKNRVKGMLTAKDKEVKALQDGMNLTEDTKILVEQIDNLREERDVLSAAIGRVHGECKDMKQYMETLQTRHTAAERVVLALRDALKDERSARNRAETQCGAMAKELKSIQIETGQTIASLRTALRDKENELHLLKDSNTSLVPPSDASALNVADYDISQDRIDNEKLCYLTQKLVQGQGKIDKLLGENNTLRIQLEKLESKYKVELASVVRQNAHSVVHFQENDQNKTRSHNQPVSSLTKLSRRIDMFVRRNPLLRIMIIMYMIGLHFWVLTVLFTSTPENYNTLNTS